MNAVAEAPAASPTAGAAPRLVRVGLVVAAIVALDQITKSVAIATLARGERVELLGDLLGFGLTTNRGGSFSLFQGSTPVLAVGALLVSAYLIHLVRTTDDRLTVVALTLLLAGATGNLSDRIFRAPGTFRGAVVDFIRIPHWPTFNVADMCITFGGILLAYRALRPPRKVPLTATAGGADPPPVARP